MNSKFRSEGYFVAPQVITEARCNQLVGELPHQAGAGTRLLLSIDSFSKLAIELRELPVLAESLRRLSAIQCILFAKNIEQNWSVRSHRDTVLPVRGVGPWPCAGVKEGLQSSKPPFDFLKNCIAVRVSMDECPEGDLEVFPRSHLDTDCKPERPIAVVVPKGGALIFRPTLFHASKKLVTSSNRRVLHYLFAPSDPPHNYKWHHAV